ncbi:MAG: ATP-binding region ATPase domain-containing protein [Candidatus Magnetoglobus multicellularis str. Araruama]|uniref:histidine kinase n=1 Tax=Candidatus Magnetoglobus multicellularis str. Araruama TaxID=890399 RepID=A0A1V1PBC2_9BACT|nr:MAG: ATP-binding region ATPase domain-containing protein [Candidatus Magnetoglobus multicellularis str. Araruama]
MHEIPGFQTQDLIYESTHTIIYKAVRKGDDLPVILKILNGEYPSPEEINRFQHEYNIIKQLEDISGVIIAHHLEKYQNSLVMVLEALEVQSLDRYIEKERLPLENCLNIGIHIAGIINDIHKQNVIHTNIYPGNILMNDQADQIKLIDFGSAAVLSRKHPVVSNVDLKWIQLAYASPELTGRMNRSVDYRTDFYSLGIMLYEILSGTKPFYSEDPLELIHYQIAKQPTPLHQVDPKIPRPLSDIVMKLLSKTAENRYQSASGIQSDLKECLVRYRSTKNILPFEIAQNDVRNIFTLPQKLYGRELEVKELLQAFERISMPETGMKSTSEMIMVCGYSGIGKTSLVNEMQSAIIRKNGYFISGKFDQLQRNIPYSAVAGAFSELMRQILTESESNLTIWRKKLLKALGNNAQVIIDVIPELELVVGQQPPVSKLPPAESQNRFNIWFKKFINVFATPNHPLVIFMDDLQWADAASLQLIHVMMASQDHSLLFIGAYRDNEVGGAHPLMLTLDEIRKSGVLVNQLALSHLELNHINQLISDTLNYLQERTSHLSELVLAKTNGNPFFINEFLKSLYGDNLLAFDQQNGVWEWDLEQIQAQGITDNVVELMADKIQKLDAKTQKVLKMASSIGNQFDLVTLSIVNETPSEKTLTALSSAVSVGLIIQLDKTKLPISTGYASPTKALFRFSHDRIQQAAYSLIPENEKKSLHWRIGQLLLAHIPKDQHEQRIFDIVNQLNFGVDRALDKNERIHLADLNLIASKRAKASAAYEPAYRYLNIAIKLLDKNCWDHHYDLTLDLYVEGAEAAFLIAKFDEMEHLIDVVIHHASGVLDQVKVYETRIQAYMAQNHPMKGVKTAYEILRLLGVRLPKKPNKIKTILGLIRTQMSVGRKNIESLLELPPMTEPYKLAAMRIMSSVAATVYFAYPPLYPILVFKQVNLSLRYGNAFVSPFVYATYGSIICGVVGDIESGYRLGKMALKLLEQINVREMRSKTYFVVNCLINHWKEHLKDTLPAFQQAYTAGMEIGDLEFAALSGFLYSYSSFFMGKDLAELHKEMESYSDAIRQLKQETILNSQEIHRQAVLNLMGRVEDPTKLIGDAFNEKEKLPKLLDVNDKTALGHLYFNKMRLCYLFHQYHRAIENSKLAEKYLEGVTATHTVGQYYFYDSLSRTAIYPFSEQNVQKQIIRRVKSDIKKMKKWADHAPMNHLHKYHIMQAELFRVTGQHDEAYNNYNKAISLAKDNKYVNDEALANELTAQMCLIRSEWEKARSYMHESRHCYLRWGAIAIVKFLEDRYYQLLEGGMGSKEEEKGFDTVSVMKASQAISGEIMLDRLLDNLMNIVIENAGADKGFLILQDNKDLVIAAHATAEKDQKIQLGVPLKNCQEIAQAIVNYVARTNETVVLTDAAGEGVFTQDPYVLKARPRSVVCMPIRRSETIIGQIYMEHGQVAGLFTPERMEILNLLIAQAAISIENAKLYNSLEESEKKYRSLYENALEGIYQSASDGRLIGANPSLAAIMGYGSPEEMIEAGTRIDKSYVNQEDYMILMKQLKATDQVIGFETQFYQKDNSIIWASLTARIVRSPQGDILGYEGSLVDITERKQKEQAEREREAAEAANKSKSEFLASMSHEIRTPMNAIFGFTELLEDQMENPLQKQYLSAIASSGKTLLSLINDILDLSKIEAGKLDIQINDVNPRTLFSEIEHIFTMKVQEKGLDLILQVDPTIPETLEMDEVRIRQILFNLVGNAVKFTDSGHIEVSLTQDQTQKSDDRLYLIFKVSDTGIGIPETQKALIFDAFKQQEGQSQAKYGGTGLGLAITKRLVEMMGGAITVESESGQGSAFSFYIPDVAPGKFVEKAPDPNDFDVESIVFNKGIVLIVDDDPDTRNLFRGFLKNQNIDIVEAENGQEGVDMARLYQVNLILMDLRMPVMNGFEAIDIIKTDDALKSIPIVIVTASVMKDSEKNILTSGCDGYLKKPVRKKELITEMMRFLSYSSTQESSEVTDSHAETPEDAIQIDPELKERLPELIQTFESEYLPEWENIQKQFIIDEIECFSEKMKQVGETYSFHALVSWANILNMQTQQFDMAKIPGTLKAFSGIFEQLKN